MRHDSYVPSSPATLQALDRMEYVMVNTITPPDVRIVGLHFIVSSHSLSVPGYIQKILGETCEPTLGWKEGSGAIPE
jgi:hypothetical protein